MHRAAKIVGQTLCSRSLRQLSIPRIRYLSSTRVLSQGGELTDPKVQRNPFSPEVTGVAEGNFGRVVAEGWLQYKDAQAMIDVYTKRKITFTQLHDQVMRVAAGLAKDGFKKGDCLAILAPNSIDYPITFFATVVLGGTVTTWNPTYTEGELLHAFENSEASYIATVPQLVNVVQAAASKLKNPHQVKRVIILEGDSEGCLPVSHLASCTGSVPEVTPDPNDTCALLYSSGTTGLPKGVMLTHRNLLMQLVQLRHPSINTSAPGVTIGCVLPLFHIFALVVMMTCSTTYGADLALYPRFEAEPFIKGITDHKVNTLYVAPPLLLLAKTGLPDKYDMTSLKEVTCAAAPASRESSDFFADRFKLDMFRQGYGLTETSPATHIDLINKPTPGSVGPTIPGLETKVVDIETGHSLPAYEKGEVCMKGDSIMKGYCKNEEATRDCITPEGWFHSGDIGYYDDEGRYFIVDRLKELIKYKGHQVAPAELEGMLVAHDLINDAAVIGVPQGEVGELPRAYVVLKPESALTEEQVMEYIQKNAAPHKALRGGVKFVKEIPKSPSGKILRKLLREEAKKEL